MFLLHYDINYKFFQKSFPPDTTVLSAEDLDSYRNGESSSSSDIEYDGTNIPELNLDYDPISSSKVTECM